MASLVLHNLLRTKSHDSCTPVGFTDRVAFDGNVVENNKSGTSPNIALLQT